MKAVGLYRYLPVDDPECFVDVELPDPAPSGRDLLVSVRAVSVNPVDTKTRAPRPGTEEKPRILGWDAAGVVVDTGPDCTLFKTGDEVFYAGSIVRPGCDSELHLVDERIVGRKPGTLSFAEAAALPLTTITAWEALFDQMRISADGGDRGQSLLVVGGAGGAGSVGIQLAKEVAGLSVIATASRDESRKWCLELGADRVVDHTGDLVEQVRSGPEPRLDWVDYIYCTNSLEKHMEALVELVAPKGRICSIVGGGSSLSARPLFDKSASFSFELMFTRPRYQTADLVEQHRLLDRAAELVERGRLRTTLRTTLSPINAENLREAHRLIEGGHTTGKIVLEGFS
ncbi:zinc-binding alcohol dehydrogenase family protein [Salinispira pacifica]